MHVPLHDGWTVTAVGGAVPEGLVGVRLPATVPGSVHLDLMAAGLIPDPYLDENELKVAWVGRVDWRYETVFDWDGEGCETDLVALGLDTMAAIELNGVAIARTSNMHRSYRFPVRDKLQVGPNALAITFAAGLTAAEDASVELGPRPHVNAHPFNALRKMACNYGWDWGPDLVTAGIWRPLSLETWHDARIDTVRPLVEVDGTTGLLHAHIDIERGSDYDCALQLDVRIGGSSTSLTLAPDETSAVIDVAVSDVDLWWPRGYGEQSLYPVTVTLSGDNGKLATWAGRVGFRTIELDTSADERGSAFTLSVNGVPMFARGANWIPDDAFPSRITPERYAERLTQARDANINLIRVWGGGIYESEDFYDTCDELGLLVWQDFLFVCAAYAEEEPLRSEVIAEAREAVTRLSAHPSLALWNGNNENIWGHEDWGWKEHLGDLTWGWGYYTDVLPAIVAELDPTRPYSPGTPYSFTEVYRRTTRLTARCTSGMCGTSSTTPHTGATFRDSLRSSDSKGHRPGRPSQMRSTTTRFGRSPPGCCCTRKRTTGTASSLAGSDAPPATREHRRLALGNLAQPSSSTCFGDRTLPILVSHLHGHGCLATQRHWPAISWSAIDSAGRRKPLWYALRRSFDDRLLTVQPRDGGLALVAVNDSGEAWTEHVSLTRRTTSGEVISSIVVAVDVAPRCTLTLPIAPELAATAGKTG